jgi:hypothetical protein
MSISSVPKLRRIPTPHPLVMIFSLLLLGVLIAAGVYTEFRRPLPIVYVAAAIFVIALNTWSRNRRAKFLNDGR